MKVNQRNESASSSLAEITPDISESHNVSGGIVLTSAVFLTLSTLFVILRIYTRGRLLRTIFADDYVIIAAWIFSAAATAACLEQVKLGNEGNLWDLPLETSGWAAAELYLYVPASALPKVAILMSYLRVFPNKDVRVRVYIVFVITIVYMVTTCLTLFLQCHPIAKSWNMSIPGYCLLKPPLIFNGIFNVAIDIMVLLVPVPFMIEWKVSTRVKVLTGGVYAVGSLTCIVCAVRVYIVARRLHDSNMTRAALLPGSLSIIETNLSVICGCVMVMRPFLQRHLPFLLGIRSERVEQISPPVVGNERPIAVLNIPSEHKLRTSAGFGGINSSVGWVWHRENRIDTHATIGAASDDVEAGRARDWPLRNELSLRTEIGKFITDER